MYHVAIQMLLGDRGKYIAMIMGIMFSALIMTQQPSIFMGLMTRTYAFISDTELPDIWVMDPSVEYVEQNKSLRDTELLRVRGIEGVAWAVPMFKGFVNMRLPDGSRDTIDMTGVDDATLIGAPPLMVKGNILDLRRADAIIVDEAAARDRFSYADASGRQVPLGIGDIVELNDRRAIVVGVCQSRPTFTTQPMIYTTYSRAMGYSPPQRRMLSYILVKAKPGTDLQDLAQRITKATGLGAQDSATFKRTNIQFWFTNTGIPINFGMSVLLGFIIGAAVAGQTFYAFVRDNLRQFAALKAMGLRDGVLLRMILLQALIVGAIGYGLGVGLSALFGYLTSGGKLAFYMPGVLLLVTWIAVLGIVAIAAIFGARSVFKLEAAVVFK